MASSDAARGTDGIRADARGGVHEHLNWRVEWRIDKYADDAAFEAGQIAETVRFRDNLLLNEGITRLLNLLIGTTTSPYNNANARIGVGDSTTAAAATQTALQAGTNFLYKAMDATYPTVSAQTVTFRSTFASADANYAWQEFSVDNGSTPSDNLNRKVQSLGTKASGATWVITASVLLS